MLGFFTPCGRVLEDNTCLIIQLWYYIYIELTNHLNKGSCHVRVIRKREDYRY